MKDRLKKFIGVMLLLAVVFGAVCLFVRSHRVSNIEQAVAETRRTLREQGFKTDLADFNLATDAAMRSRELELTSYGGSTQVSPADAINLLPTVADGSAVILWKQDWIQSDNGNVTWADFQDALEENRLGLDAACDAALSGPIQFDLDASRGRAMLLPHLAALRHWEQMLGSRTVLELHDKHSETAWTNLLALTRLATAWKVEPVEIAHLVRFYLVNFGFNATWQALQNNEWPDAKLAALQREWESADFFTNLPDTAAFLRASDVDLCRQERQQPLAGGMPLSQILQESIHEPWVAISAIKQSITAARYRSYGTYDDEKNIMLFYQQRELELRHAIASPSWVQMRGLPGVTNTPIFTSPYRSRVSSVIGLHASGARMSNPNSTLLSRAATAEARRRIIVAAMALERFRRKHGSYPKAITELAPEFMAAVPVDFIDGQPLRYRLADDGHFMLYSVGLDCVDNGGKLPPPRSRPGGRAGLGMPGLTPDTDIVWPRPASAEAVAMQNEMDADADRAKADEIEDLQANAQWEHTARHQADLDTVLAAPAVKNVPDIKVGGHPLSETLHNAQTSGTNKLSLLEMLTLKQVTTGGEPETITFELPIAYDVMTNLGEVHLYIDPTNNDDSDMGCDVMDLNCSRATNGDCLLAWNTIYESPGRHALQGGLFINGRPQEKNDIAGPLLPFATTNLCQFSLGSQHFEPGLGAGFHAKLPEANASYVIEINTTNGERLQTISGSTSNGELQVFWNLVDSRGRHFTGDEFSSVFHLTLPNSGRTQTLRGP